MGSVVASGRGRLYSWAVPHHPQAAGFRYPVLVGLIELEEGTRLVSNIVACRRRDLTIGMPLEVCWLDSHPALVEGASDSQGPITLPQFRPARPSRRLDTLTGAAVAAGDELPLCPVPITPTLAASDSLVDVNTSLGLSERWISDWAGPEAVFRNISLSLGVPCHPGDTLTLTGAVTASDPATGRVTVGFTGFNLLGDHVTGTADLVLPTRPARPQASP
jgi:hypothetical protein